MMLNFGRFNLQNVVIERYEASKFSKSKASYNLFVKLNNEQEEETFFVVANNLKGFDLVSAERSKNPCNISGTILKNTISHKTIFIVDEEGTIEAI